MTRMTQTEKRAAKQQSAAEAILWATLEKLAKSEYSREELAAGKYAVEVVISAEIDGESVETEISAEANIQGGGTYQPSIKAPADHLLAILWSYLPETVRLQLSIDLPAHYTEHKELPEVAPVHLVAIEKLTKRLTARGAPKPKAGAINASRV